MIVVDTNIISYLYVSGSRSQQAETLLSDHEFEVSSAQVMRLVKSSHCSSYDCEFVALAQYLHSPLVTADKKIIREFSDTAIFLNSYLT